MGGTTFFGQRLIAHLLKEGCAVTVATRGKRKCSFGTQVQQVKFDRNDLSSLSQYLIGKYYDIIYDQICFCADDMVDACNVFSGHVGHYVFTSSVAVYLPSPGLAKVETDFTPVGIDCIKGRYPQKVGYVMGKQQAEACLFKYATFPFSVVRIPMVIGLGDPTERLEFLVRRILAKKPIVIPPDSGQMNFVESDDAGRFLAWLGLTGRTGVYNAGSEEWITPTEMTNIVGKVVGVEPVLVDSGNQAHRTEYAYACDLTVDVSKARLDGFEFRSFNEWFPDIVKKTLLIVEENPLRPWSPKVIKGAVKKMVKSVMKRS